MGKKCCGGDGYSHVGGHKKRKESTKPHSGHEGSKHSAEPHNCHQAKSSRALPFTSYRSHSAIPSDDEVAFDPAPRCSRLKVSRSEKAKNEEHSSEEQPKLRPRRRRHKQHSAGRPSHPGARTDHKQKTSEHNVSQTTVSCNCGGSLFPDELTNAAPGKSEADMFLHVPHGLAEIGIGAAIGTTALGGGIVTAVKVTKEFDRRASELEKAIEDMDSPELDISHTDRKAYLDMLKTQHRDVCFQRDIAGKMSGVGSLGILAGVFFPVARTLGLATLTEVGRRHVDKTSQQQQENDGALNRATTVQSNDREVRAHIFKEREKHLNGNKIAWSAFTAGATGIVATDIAGYAGYFAPPLLLLASALTLVGGALATAVHNTILTGGRFGYDLNRSVKQTLDAPLSETEVEQRNLEAFERLRVSTTFSKACGDSNASPEQKKYLAEQKKYKNRRMGLKVKSYASLGLASMHSGKHIIRRDSVMKAVNPEHDPLRMDALKELVALKALIHENELCPGEDGGIKIKEAKDAIEEKNLIGMLEKAGELDAASSVLKEEICKRKNEGWFLPKIVKREETFGWSKLISRKKGDFILRNRYTEDFKGKKEDIEALANGRPVAQSGHGHDHGHDHHHHAGNHDNCDHKGCSHGVSDSKAFMTLISDTDKGEKLTKGSTEYVLRYNVRSQADRDMYAWSDLSDKFKQQKQGAAMAA